MRAMAKRKRRTVPVGLAPVDQGSGLAPQFRSPAPVFLPYPICSSLQTRCTWPVSGAGRIIKPQPAHRVATPTHSWLVGCPTPAAAYRRARNRLS